MKSLKHIYFIFYIFFQILTTSLLALKFDVGITYTATVVLSFILLILGLLDFFSKKHNALQLLYLIGLILLILVFRKDMYIRNVFIIALYLIDESLEIQWKLLFKGILLGFITVIFCSLIGIISKYNAEGIDIALGFRNQNTTGYLLSFLSISAFLLYSRHRILYLLISLFVIFVDMNVFDDYTASIMVILPVILISMKKIFYRIRYIIIFIPIFLTSISLYIGNNYGDKWWMNQLNQLVTNRPIIWHYYLTHYPINYFGNHLEVFSSGFNYTIGEGAFDGAYIYILIVNGLLALSILLISSVLLNYILLKKNKWWMFSIIITIEIVGFSENTLFNYFESPVSWMAIIAIYQILNIHEKRKEMY